MCKNSGRKQIEFINVSKKYKNGHLNQHALIDINITINQGDFVGILGMNGSGKSTFARLINGLIQPSSGNVLVNGLDSSVARHLREIRRHVGMVFQNPDNQIISSIVEEDIAFGPENLGLSEKEVRERIDWVVKTLALEDIRHRAPHLLSGGQKQKVAIASALAMKPSCLVLDEPTSMLDQKSRLELIDLLGTLNASGITIILITHNIEDVSAANRLMFLNNGSVYLDGSPQTVTKSQKGLQKIGFQPPDIVQLIYNLRERGHSVAPEIANTDDLAEYICKK